MDWLALLSAFIGALIGGFFALAGAWISRLPRVAEQATVNFGSFESNKQGVAALVYLTPSDKNTVIRGVKGCGIRVIKTDVRFRSRVAELSSWSPLLIRPNDKPPVLWVYLETTEELSESGKFRLRLITDLPFQYIDLPFQPTDITRFNIARASFCEIKHDKESCNCTQNKQSGNVSVMHKNYPSLSD
ncbi:hypothetical protein [Turicimonas muris]|uniref:hypothetical protein n=1 Tax=Turicimonas muris TaxID=1796652 RepID=UPI002494B7C5|nr:hypothetical protein [Turicimonas muris]